MFVPTQRRVSIFTMFETGYADTEKLKNKIPATAVMFCQVAVLGRMVVFIRCFVLG